MNKTLLFLLLFASICRPVFAQHTPVEEFTPGVKWGMSMTELFETRLAVSNSSSENEVTGPFLEQMDGNPVVQASYSFFSLNNMNRLSGLSNISFEFLDDVAALATARQFAGSDFNNRSTYYWTLDDGSAIVMSLWRNRMQLQWRPLVNTPKK